MKHLIFIIICLIALTHCDNITYVPNPNQSVVTNMTDCEGKLANQDEILNATSTEKICSELQAHPNFIIRISKYYSSLVHNSLVIEATSVKFFKAQCKNFPTMCNDGFLIDIYTHDRIVIVQPGIQSKRVVNDAYRDRVIQTIRVDLAREEWEDSLVKAIRLLDYKENKGKITLNAPQSSEPYNFKLFVLTPILLLMLSGLTFILAYIGFRPLNEELFNYLDKILLYWDEIVASPDKYIEIDTCLFCFKNENVYKFMYCNHSYHEGCLKRWKLYEGKCCPCSYIPTDEDEEKSKLLSPIQKKGFVNTDDLRILLSMILDAHRKESIYEYFYRNEQKIAEFNIKHDENLEELTWVYHDKLVKYKKYRIFYKIYKAFKVMCCILAFYPSFLSTKKGKLVKKLINIRSKGATVRGFR